MLHRGEAIPSLAPYDFLLVMGGAMDVWETEDHPWLKAEKAAIQAKWDLAEFDEDSAARLLPEVDVVICYGVWTWVPDGIEAEDSWTASSSADSR